MNTYVRDLTPKYLRPTRRNYVLRVALMDLWKIVVTSQSSAEIAEAIST